MFLRVLHSATSIYSVGLFLKNASDFSFIFVHAYITTSWYSWVSVYRSNRDWLNGRCWMIVVSFVIVFKGWSLDDPPDLVVIISLGSIENNVGTLSTLLMLCHHPGLNWTETLSAFFCLSSAVRNVGIYLRSLQFHWAVRTLLELSLTVRLC